MKHDVKLRSEAYYAHEDNPYNMLAGVVVKTTANSVWIEENLMLSDRRALRAIVSRLDDSIPQQKIIRKWMLKDNGLWKQPSRRSASRKLNFKLDPLLEFTFG